MRKLSQRLAKAAEPAGTFKRKLTAYRIAAVQGLGEARTPAAMTALRTLITDRDREVREAAARALTHADRRRADDAGVGSRQPLAPIT